MRLASYIVGDILALKRESPIYETRDYHQSPASTLFANRRWFRSLDESCHKIRSRCQLARKVCCDRRLYLPRAHADSHSGRQSIRDCCAVFLNGTNSRPEVLRYSAKVRDPASATLQAESLDYDPKEDPGYVLSGFQRSKTCKGLNLSDGKIDSAHIYWNHESLRFDDWVR